MTDPSAIRLEVVTVVNVVVRLRIGRALTASCGLHEIWVTDLCSVSAGALAGKNESVTGQVTWRQAGPAIGVRNSRMNGRHLNGVFEDSCFDNRLVATEQALASDRICDA